MPRTTHVERAQPRYAMVVVTDDDGNPVKIPPTKKDGSPKTTKTGREVTITKSRRDYDNPLPLLKCDYPQCPEPDKEIQLGTPYKHISPKSGPYGGKQRNRHESCPQWNVWEYSSSTSAMVAQAQNDCHSSIDNAELGGAEDFDSLRDELKEVAEALYQEKQDNLDNLPEGLQSGSELEEIVGNLESWCEAIGEVEAPEFPELDESDCDACEGEGEIKCEGCDGDGEIESPDGRKTIVCPDCDGAKSEECGDCDGTGQVEDDEVSEEALSEWVDEAKDALREAVDGYEG